MRVSSLDNRIFFNKYKPEKKIGEGSFGKIYLSHNINTGEKFALKLENKNITPSLLEQEAYILCYLKGEGIPFIKSFGISTEFNVLVMELLGKSLEYLFEKMNKKFSLKTVCMLGIQMITRLQYIHNKHILHRDIKPDNFIMGLDNNSWKVYLIDFGLSKKYRSSKTLKHINFAEHKKLIGTARYASINALAECEQGRRDDMEALGYVLMYFLKGNLPWQGLKINRRDDRYRKIYEKKKETTAEELCKGFPKEFCEFVKYTRKLEFEEEPDYDYLRNLLKQVMKDKNYAYSKMCTHETLICENLRKQFCYANRNNIDELRKLTNKYCESFMKNLEEFSDKLYPTLGDSLNIWSIIASIGDKKI